MLEACTLLGRVCEVGRGAAVVVGFQQLGSETVYQAFYAQNASKKSHKTLSSPALCVQDLQQRHLLVCVVLEVLLCQVCNTGRRAAIEVGFQQPSCWKPTCWAFSVCCASMKDHTKQCVPALCVKDLEQRHVLVRVVLEACTLLRRVCEVGCGAAIDVGFQQLARSCFELPWRQALMRCPDSLHMRSSGQAVAVTCVCALMHWPASSRHVFKTVSGAAVFAFSSSPDAVLSCAGATSRVLSSQPAYVLE